MNSVGHPGSGHDWPGRAARGAATAGEQGAPGSPPDAASPALPRAG